MKFFFIKLKNFTIRTFKFSFYFFFIKFKKPIFDSNLINKVSYLKRFDKNQITSLQSFILNLPLDCFKPSDTLIKSKINLHKYSSPKEIIEDNEELFGELTLLNPESYENFQFLLSENLFEILKNYTSRKFFLNGLNIRISFNSHKNLKDQYMFHRDRDSYEVIKYFVYLTDVNEENGPFIFLENSYKQKFIEIFKHRFSEEFIKKNYLHNSAVRVTGPAGTSFICSTNSFHKQGANNRGFRIMVTFKFGVENWNQNNSFNKSYFSCADKYSFVLANKNS